MPNIKIVAITVLLALDSLAVLIGPSFLDLPLSTFCLLDCCMILRCSFHFEAHGSNHSFFGYWLPHTQY